VFRKLENQSEDIRDIKRLIAESNGRDPVEPEDFTSIPKLPVSNEADIQVVNEWVEFHENYALLVGSFKCRAVARPLL